MIVDKEHKDELPVKMWMALSSAQQLFCRPCKRQASQRSSRG